MLELYVQISAVCLYMVCYVQLRAVLAVFVQLRAVLAECVQLRAV